MVKEKQKNKANTNTVMKAYTDSHTGWLYSIDIFINIWKFDVHPNKNQNTFAHKSFGMTSKLK